MPFIKYNVILFLCIKRIFGKPDETIVCVGDWEQRKHRKYKKPIKGKGFRTLFRRNGYKVYLVDEFRTSCRCSKCNGGNCEKFRKCRNPKPMLILFILYLFYIYIIIYYEFHH
jgi:hypothetical protein